MFDNRTFITAYHVLEPLLDHISDWNEIVFKDQNENQHEFKIKGLKFISKLRDMVTLEVSGYEGPVLEPATEPTKEQSYVIGYSDEFKIQPVHSFKVNDIFYGAIPELFDCFYGYQFQGSSGGPLLNEKGKVKAVFTNIIDPFSDGCSILFARRPAFSTEEIQNNQIYASIEKVKELMLLEQNKLAQLALEGDINARVQFSIDTRNISFNSLEEMKETLMSDKGLNAIRFREAAEVLGRDDLVLQVTKTIDEKIDSSEAQDLLSVIWYAKGLATYYREPDLEKACEFWDKARQTGHPFVRSDFVIVPNRKDIISCGF